MRNLVAFIHSFITVYFKTIYKNKAHVWSLANADMYIHAKIASFATVKSCH